MKLPNCYCINCYKFNEDDIVTKTSSLMGTHTVSFLKPFKYFYNLFQGWVRFPLKSAHGSHSNSYHVAFYYSRPGLIRNILETKQLLTEGK